MGTWGLNFVGLNGRLPLMITHDALNIVKGSNKFHESADHESQKSLLSHHIGERIRWIHHPFVDLD